MKNLITYLILIIIAGGGGFYGGTIYQKNKLTSNPQELFQAMRQNGGFSQNQNNNQNSNRPTGRMFGDGGQVTGEITSVDDKSITVKMQDGSSKIVILSDKTSINKATEAAKTDLKVGEKVSAFGITNSDGSVTAQNIQLNPIVRTTPNNN